MSKVVINKKCDVVYPVKDVFIPSESYPEYPFKITKSSIDNPVYSMVRESLCMMGYDEKHYNT